MAKYNIRDKKEMAAAYRNTVSPVMMDWLQEKIMNIIVMQKKYCDKSYSAKELARDVGTNTRYISAVINERFRMNYTSFINKFRIDDAIRILEDKRYQDLNVEDVGKLVGFTSRMTFYSSFYRNVGMTPREYRIQHLQILPPKGKKKKGA
ncbi:helix-turn-helix domain-containing protein [Pseudobutyrivibrio sp.]|jgi:AraC-like DNA-binding protein|uniref:helix-turn-helix domain-containing protein n=1 Tax=Pseudobutyrivibrio sp. TaxID=2014367 RepID=UPI0025FF41B1|nr:helix-turn-helix domain-containing protein [Pseudobutyrivibrio sp.]